MSILKYIPIAATVGAVGYLVYHQVRDRMAKKAIVDKATEATRPIGDVIGGIGDRIGGLFDGESNPSESEGWGTQTAAFRAQPQNVRGAVTVDWQNVPQVRQVSLPRYGRR